MPWLPPDQSLASPAGRPLGGPFVTERDRTPISKIDLRRVVADLEGHARTCHSRRFGTVRPPGSNPRPPTRFLNPGELDSQGNGSLERWLFDVSALVRWLV